MAIIAKGALIRISGSKGQTSKVKSRTCSPRRRDDLICHARETGFVVGAPRSIPSRDLAERAQRPRALHFAVSHTRGNDARRFPTLLDPLFDRCHAIES